MQERTKQQRDEEGNDDDDDDGGGGGEYVYAETNGVRERLVTPYYFDFTSGVKRRWEGKTLLEVFMKEFPIRSEEYYRKAIESGRLCARRNGKKTTTTNARKKNGSRDPETPPPPPPPTSRKEEHDGGILRGGDMIVHRVHRHEPPVFAQGIPIRVEGAVDDYVAVYKPAGMPVHPCGQYRKNTLLMTLEKEQPHLMPLFASNRLDVPVSGVVVLARSADAARKLCKLHEVRHVRKFYVARVAGDCTHLFKTNDNAADDAEGNDNNNDGGHKVIACDAPLGYDPSTRRAFVADVALDDDNVDATATATGKGNAAAKSTQQQQQQQRTNKKRKSCGPGTESTRNGDGVRMGSPAKTKFRMLCLSDDGKSSCVLCEPITGRTHQIRIHLAHLGHPIVNDAIYNPEIQEQQQQLRGREDVEGGRTPTMPVEVKCTVVGLEPSWTIENACPHCPHLRSPDFNTKPPQQLWLHAMHYAASPLFSFTCVPPEWAMRNRWTLDVTSIFTPIPFST